MKCTSTGGCLAAATLAVCLAFAAPAQADSEIGDVDAAKVAMKEMRKMRPPRGLATYKMIMARHAKSHGVPYELVKAVVWHESKYKARAIGSSGERGLMQIMPATARGLGYRGNVEGLHDPEVNIKLGVKYLAKAYRMADGDLCQTVLRYNAGLGAKQMTTNAAKYCAKVKKYLGIPEPIPMNMP